jgi:hypothetical protein
MRHWELETSPGDSEISSLYNCHNITAFTGEEKSAIHHKPCKESGRDNPNALVNQLPDQIIALFSENGKKSKLQRKALRTR